MLLRFQVYKSDSIRQPHPTSHPAHMVKATGAINLHLATRTMPSVRTFMLVSSIARHLAPPNQVNATVDLPRHVVLVDAGLSSHGPACQLQEWMHSWAMHNSMSCVSSS